ncbi:MAG: precorrin-4 C(11)-methyltransferase [Alphaproteobacteria bacterium]
MTVHFIGAGPGAADLITVRGLKLIRACPLVLYAGSLVPTEIVAEAGPDARVIDTAPLTLDEIIAEMAAADGQGWDVARVHSGDPALYGAIAEQMRRLDALAIAHDITPGVPSYAAAAAALGRELTLPGVSQSLVLTRTAVRSSDMPEGETLAVFGASGATLAIHLSINNLARVVRDLVPHYGADCPVAVVYRASWPEEIVLRGRLDDIRPKVKAAGITRTALILVGRALDGGGFPDSKLYDPAHHHVLRPRKK